MRWLKSLFVKRKGPRPEKNTSHTQKSSNSNKTDINHRSAALNDGISRDRPQDPHPAKRAQSPHRSDNRNEKSDQTRHVYKGPYSIKERIKYIGKYIDRWNKNHPHDYIEIDIIVIGGLLDINQNWTEPAPDSQIKFICRPGKRWDDELYTEKLHRACKKLEWQINDRWCLSTLDSGVRRRMFEVIKDDKPAHKSKGKGMIIRKPPPDYRLCQRIARLGSRESNSQLYDTKLSGIVKDIESYIDSNEQQLEGIRSRLKKGVTPRDLIRIWQKEYDFEFSNVLSSLKDNRVEGSKPREHIGTRIHESHRVNGPHDSAVSLPTGQRSSSKSRAYLSNYGSESDTSTSTPTRPRRVKKQHDSAVSLSGTGQRAPIKSDAHEPSDYVSDSSKSTRSRRTQDPSQPPFQPKPPTKSNCETLPKTTPHTRLPAIKINSLSEDRTRSSGKSPSRKSPGRSPHTPRTTVGRNHVYQNTGKPPLPPFLHPSDRSRQKSPARPGSGDRRMMTHEKSHRDTLDPSTSQSQSRSYSRMQDIGNTKSRPEVRPRKSHRDLSNDNLRFRPQKQVDSNLYSSIDSNRRNGYPGSSHQDPFVVSPVDSPEDMPLKGLTPEQKDEAHKIAMEVYKKEDLHGRIFITHEY
ncbi:uncharacterized protein EAF01_009751 [Botrytis porri]|nr:uncharacterized protein EAF01_009751 [Botrytis porri]KAF7895789.1 hypothetical protein EAF01_009751 [Botrytis porri]